MIESAPEPDVVYWTCVHGHVFRAALPPAGEIVRCPGRSGPEPCLSSLVYEPFDSEQDARAAAEGRSAVKPNYAPWAAPRRPVSGRLAYWSAG